MAFVNPTPSITRFPRVVDRFRNPVRPTHNGVDLAAPQGSPVVASMGGRVRASGWLNPLAGFGVEISNGNTVTRYLHLLADGLPAVGQQVTAGQTIGRVGQSGNAVYPHVHYEIRVGGAPVDPLDHIALPFGDGVTSRPPTPTSPGTPNDPGSSFLAGAGGFGGSAPAHDRLLTMTPSQLRALTCEELPSMMAVLDVLSRMKSPGQVDALISAAKPCRGFGSGFTDAAAGVLDAAVAVPRFLARLSDGQLWIRFGMGIGGAALMFAAGRAMLNAR